MKPFVYALAAAASLTLGSSAHAAAFRFETDPFAGSNAGDPGRQIVGGESFITFDVTRDVFSLESTVFGLTGTEVNFFNGPIATLPTDGINVVVLQTFDNDNDPTTPFAAGTAANLIANQVSTPGAGFFIYFNSGLDLPRLVFSTDLSDSTADLKILFRMTNLAGQAGRDTIPRFTADNFEVTAVPEPATLALLALGMAGAVRGARQRRR
ncbi:MAG TPA: PEP-CTERM sorting domain-containing protein [Luteitalea sp.]|nr:PEP-CTERM sorting domain-containing protein [Luteitalea sp.]